MRSEGMQARNGPSAGHFKAGERRLVMPFHPCVGSRIASDAQTPYLILASWR